ncbi:putative alkane 1-monooxygenase [Helianthus debilis subsp. tardiflorus]
MNHEADQKFIFFTANMRKLGDHSGVDPTKFLRDTLVNFMAAQKDTISSSLSWFFYFLARSPTLEEKILEEIKIHIWRSIRVKDGTRKS